MPSCFSTWKFQGFQGGYVGVDLFFVISGFLISGLIRERIATGAFTLSSFYANRVRRLMPAVIATVVATSVASVFILQPQMLSAFAGSAVAALFSVANLVFFAESGYWDANSDLKPLLHMWSLGVEEQFYLFWPALLVVLTRRGAKPYYAGLVIIFCASLGACIWTTSTHPEAAFYLLPFRVWQFCLGALIVEGWRHASLSLFQQQFLRSTGLALCGVAIATYSPNTPFPGWQALLPSIGAALVLLANNSAEPSPVLSNQPARWLGKVSYSLYLVHWPPIALYRCLTLQDLTPSVQWGLGGLTILLTLLLHYGVEKRFYQRGHSDQGHWRGVPAGALLLSALMSVPLIAGMMYPSSVSQRDLPLSAERIERYKTDRFMEAQWRCRIDWLEDPKRCPAMAAPVLFIGNSHEPDALNTLLAALPEGAKHNMVRFGSSNGCGELSVEGDRVRSAVDGCQRRLDAVLNSVESVTWRAVVYSARRHTAAERAPLIKLMEQLKRAQPDLELIVFGDFMGTAHDCASLINQFGTPLACRDSEHVDFFAPDTPIDADVGARLSAITDTFVDRVSVLCNQRSADTCQIRTPDGHPAFVDRHHLTLEFATYLGGLLAEDNPDWLANLAQDMVAD